MSEAPTDRQRNQTFRLDPARFVPSGVDAQSWIGFEQRIQERRFRALLDSMTAAIDRGDSISARMALEEARELRPDAPELEEAAGRVALLPMAVPVMASQSHARTRAVNAVGLLVVGVALLVAIDWIRPNGPAADPIQPAAAPPAVTVPDLQSASAEPVPEPVEERLPAEEPLPDEALSAPVESTIGTIGIRPAIAVETQAPPRPITRQPVIQPAAAVAPPPPVVTPSAEVPEPIATSQPLRRDPAPSTAIADTLRAAREAETTTAGPPVIPSAPPIESAPPAASAAAAAVVAPREDERVESVLNQYARAYTRLDAGAAREVWPSVNERALARAFAGLESQNLAFDDCSIDVRGQTANASCRGRASYVGKVGNRELRTEPRQWTFELRRDGEAWKIESAQTNMAQ